MAKSFKIGDKVRFEGKSYTIESRISSAFTLVSEDKSEYIGVHKTDKRLKHEVEKIRH